MSRPSSSSEPALISSRPAINRSSVDLPQPEGPTKTTNSPRSMTRSMPWMTWASPNFFSMPLSWRNAIVFLSRLLHGAEGQALHQLLLAEPAEHDDGRDRHQRGGRELGPEQPFRA